MFTKPVIQVVCTDENIKEVGKCSAKYTITLEKNVRDPVKNCNELNLIPTYLFYPHGLYLSMITL